MRRHALNVYQLWNISLNKNICKLLTTIRQRLYQLLEPAWSKFWAIQIQLCSQEVFMIISGGLQSSAQTWLRGGGGGGV